MKKGIMAFYLSYKGDAKDLSFREQISLFKELNSNLFKELEEEVGYKIAIIPTTGESARVEKIDFDLPYPRHIPYSIDVHENEENKRMLRKMLEKSYEEEK